MRTRDLVVRQIVESGPTSAANLAAKLKITSAGIRRHLDSLISEGVLASREAHKTSALSRGRGRPAKLFLVTDLGREKFEQSYDDLAVSALRFMATKNGAHLLSEFAISRAEDIERRAEKFLTAKENQHREKSEALADFLTGDGFAANVKENPAGQELCQNHCPVAHVAAQFPELCDAETEAISRLLGTHVQRLATIAHGDGVCTTFIPKGFLPHQEPSTNVPSQLKKKVGASS